MKLRLMTLALSVLLCLAPRASNAATKAEIDAALAAGVEWLAGQQETNGSWTGSNLWVGDTGMALAVLGHYAQRLGTTPLAPGYAYSDNMQAGLDYMFSQAVRNAADERVWFGNANINSADNYVVGPVLMGIAMSATPNRVVDVTGSDVEGLTYLQVVKEIVNYLAFSQIDVGNGIGAWDYTASGTNGDQSINGWVTLGLGYARDRFGVALPQAVLDGIDASIDIIQWQTDETDPRYGGAGYRSSSGATGYENWINIYKTGHLLYMMELVGDTPATPRVQRSLGFLERHWNAPNSGEWGYPGTVNNYWDVGWRGGPGDPPSPLPSYIATVATMKGLVALGVTTLTLPNPGPLDWFGDMSTVVVDNQAPDGSWTQGGYPSHYGAKLHTIWALLTLLRAAPVDPVLAEQLIDFIRGGGCFIATAAFGSYQHPMVRLLRDFRDRYLAASAPGRALVRFYYRHSPAPAAWIADRPLARAAARAALLPVYAGAWLFLNPLLALVLSLSVLLVFAAGGRRRPLLAGAACLVVLLAGTPAQAGRLNINHFSPGPGEPAFVGVRTSAVLPADATAAGLFATWARKPLEGLVGGAWEEISKRQVVGVLNAAYGFTPNFQLGLSFPYLFTQDTTLLVDKPKSSGGGDLRIEGKYRFHGGRDSSGFALAPFFVLNSGSEKALMSGDTNSAGLLLIFDYNWCDHSVLAFNVGYQYQSERVMPNPFKIKHGLLFGLGASKLLGDGLTTVSLEAVGRTDDGWFSASEATPLELLGSVTRDLNQRVSLTGGAGAGLVKGYGAPDFRLFLGLRAGF